MEKSIFKYTLETTDKQVVKLPKGAEILTIQTQFEEPQLWALVNPENELEERTIEIFGTGHPVNNMEFTLAELREIHYLVNNGVKSVTTNSDKFILRSRIISKLNQQIRELITSIDNSDSK